MRGILGFGEILIDFAPSGFNDQGMALYARNPGGGVPNMLAMFSKLGGKASFVGKVGKDAFGDFLLTSLQACGIDASGLLWDEKVMTTLAIVSLREDGERAFSLYRWPGADIMLREEELPLDRIGDCSMFHFGGVTLTDEPVGSATLNTAVYARGLTARRLPPGRKYLPWQCGRRLDMHKAQRYPGASAPLEIEALQRRVGKPLT